MKTITRLRTFFLFISIASLTSCLPDSFTKFEEAPANSSEAPSNDGGTSPTIPGAGTSSCVGSAAQCYGPSDIRYADKVFDLDNPGGGENFGPTIIGNDVPVDQLKFSLKSAIPLGLSFNPNTGEFFGVPVKFFKGEVEVHIEHIPTGKPFVRFFDLEASREVTSISYHIPLNEKVIITLADEEKVAIFNSTQSIVTEKGTKAKIDYIDPVTNEFFLTITKAGPISIGDKIDNNAFFVSEKATLAKAVIAIDKEVASSTRELKLVTEPKLSDLIDDDEDKPKILSFTTDPTDKVDDDDPTGLNGEFTICDDIDNADCDGDLFGALVLQTGKIQEEKSIQVKVDTLSGNTLSAVVTYRVLEFAKPKSITKVVYPQRANQKLILKLEDEEQAEAFTRGGYVSNERGAVAKVNFVSGDQLFVRIVNGSADDNNHNSINYFEPGDKIDNEANFFFEEATLPTSETDSSVTYAFAVGSDSIDPDVGAPSTDNFFLRPDFYFPDGKTKLFDNTTAEEAQVRMFVSPNPSTKEGNITYGQNLAGSYSFDFCDVLASNNGKFDVGVDTKNSPESDCNNKFYPAGTTIHGDNSNADGGIFTFSFCDDGDRIYESSDPDVNNKAACDALGGSNTWHTAGLLALADSTEIETVMGAQVFQVSVKNALGSEHKFIFKMSFDNPPQKLSVNKYLLLPVNNTSQFDIGDYISTSAPPDSNIDCRSSALALSLQNFGGTFSAISGADSLINNDDFWNCGVGVVTDIYDSGRTIFQDTVGFGEASNPSPRIYHGSADSQKYLGIKLIKGRFVKNQSIDNVKIFASEKTKVNNDPIPYSMTLAVSSATNLDALLDNGANGGTAGDNIFDRTLDFDPTDDNTLAFGQVVAAFDVDNTDGAGTEIWKILIRTTPNEAACSNPDVSGAGGTCRFITDALHRIENPADGSALASDVRLEFIQSESLFVSSSAKAWKKGDELTADPADPDVDGSGNDYLDYLVTPLNGVVMNHAEVDEPQFYDIFVRKGAMTDTTAAVIGEGQRGLIRNSNPFSGSKYYYTKGAPHSEKDENTDGTVSDPFGTSDTSVQIVDSVKSSDVLYLYKDDPVLIPSFVEGSANTVFEVSPVLPEGLFLDPQSGEIRGAPKGKSDPRVYAIKAINPFGSTTSYFSIEVMEYFGIELFATDTEPFSYILHKEGQANELTQCRVLKKQIERTQNAATFNEAKAVKKLVDIGCWLDGGERDLYEKGINLAVRIPNNTCEYVVHEPYQFYAFKPGTTTGAGFENSKLIYEHTTEDFGAFSGDGHPEAWYIPNMLQTTGADRTVHVGASIDSVEAVFTQAANCADDGSITNNWSNADPTEILERDAFYPEIGSSKVTDVDSLGRPFGTTPSAFDNFRYPNGDAVKDIFGVESMTLAGDAKKFACSYNYEISEDETGPACDDGKVSVRKVKWRVGGGRCYVEGFGFFDVDNERVKTTVRDNRRTTNTQDANFKIPSDAVNGPCKDFELAGTGLKCETGIAEGAAGFDAADEACAQADHGNLLNCLNDTANDCRIVGEDYQSAGGLAETNKFCHVPTFSTVEFSLKPEDNTVSDCGGSQNNCMSGPAVENEAFASTADGSLVSVVHNVVKEDGFDSLGGTTFSYSRARESLLGNGERVQTAVGHNVYSNIYLANYIGHPEHEDQTGPGSTPNYGSVCSFGSPSTTALAQPTQYDIDAMVRGLGFSVYGGLAGVTDQQAVDAGYQGISNKSLITEPLHGSRPYYGFKCVDSADNVVARIRLIVRDWNKTFKPSDHISFVSPDLGHCNSGVTDANGDVALASATGHLDAHCDDSLHSEEGLMDNDFQTIYDATTYNDFLDWDDFGLAKDQDTTSCFNLDMKSSENNKIKSRACFGQCIRDDNGLCIGDGTTAECWDRDEDECLFDDLDNPTGCILSNFPAFNY